MSSLRRNCLTCGVLLCVALTANSYADLSYGSWYMNQSGELADGVDYARVDITADSDTGVVQFHVFSFDVPDLGGGGANLGFQSFGFNLDGISDSPSEWSWSLPSQWKWTKNRRQGGFGKYDVVISKASGGHRQDALDFSLTLDDPDQAIVDNFANLSSGNAGDGNMLFAAHFAGFNAPPGSHYIGGTSTTPTPVPTPSAAGLGAIGVLAAGLLRRKLS